MCVTFATVLVALDAILDCFVYFARFLNLLFDILLCQRVAFATITLWIALTLAILCFLLSLLFKLSTDG